jgi:glucose-6-phosphate dehydrogenase assembly protein OpcA
VIGGEDSPSADLLAGWLATGLQCPVDRQKVDAGRGVVAVTLQRDSGPITLERPQGSVADLTQPGQPKRRLSLPPRADRECLAEELRRLDPDDVYTTVLTQGLGLLDGAPVGA